MVRAFNMVKMAKEKLIDWLEFQIASQEGAYKNPDKTEDQKAQIRGAWAAYENVLRFVKQENEN